MQGDEQKQGNSEDKTYQFGLMSLEQILEPPISKFQEKYYSLEPDMLNGWRPNRKIFRQLPTRYSYTAVDLITEEYTRFGQVKDYRVMYLGPRPSSNLRAMKSYCEKEYEPYVKECFLYGCQKMFRYNYKYCKEKEQMFPHLTSNRIFTGMNPTIDNDQLIFDADFECGNLDLVMKVEQNEYDLFMRVDSNTRGHNSWFFFKVRNTRTNTTIKFNICNFHKANTLYNQGLKPYFFSKLTSKRWQQMTDKANVRYRREPLRYPVCDTLKRRFFCLSFEFQPSQDYDQIYFAYSIPYSYSYLLNYIQQLREKQTNKNHLNIAYNLESSSGLSVPVLTITNQQASESKKTVLITCRQHPGETQGSWMMHGLLAYLCSDEAANIRSQLVFKIIPMLNPDGVVLGNFRTCVLGVDLNRQFREEDGQDCYEVEHVKEMAVVKNTLMYLDFHGHSTRKSVFIYGPDYKLNQTEYIPSRILPKQISKLTQMFRYYGCIFKISRGKEKTARAALLRDFKIPYCYTVEASTHSYTSQEGDVEFTSQLYCLMGSKIGESLCIVGRFLLGVEKKKQIIRQKIQKMKEKRNENFSKKERKGRSMSNQKISEPQILLADDDSGLDTIAEMLSEIGHEDKSLFENPEEGGSDSEESQDDYDREERMDFLKKACSIGPKEKKEKSAASVAIRPRQRKSEIVDNSLKKRMRDNSLLEQSQWTTLDKDVSIQIKRSDASPKNYEKKKGLDFEGRVTSDMFPLVTNNFKPDKKLDSGDKGREKNKDLRRDLERLYVHSQKLVQCQPERLRGTKVTDLNIQSQITTLARENKKLQTIDFRANEPEHLNDYNNQSKMVSRHCGHIVINIPFQASSQISDKKFSSLQARKLPQIGSRKDLLPRKKRLEVINAQAMPGFLSDILRRHMRMIEADSKQRHLNRSIQITKL